MCFIFLFILILTSKIKLSKRCVQRWIYKSILFFLGRGELGNYVLMRCPFFYLFVFKKGNSIVSLIIFFFWRGWNFPYSPSLRKSTTGCVIINILIKSNQIHKTFLILFIDPKSKLNLENFTIYYHPWYSFWNCVLFLRTCSIYLLSIYIVQNMHVCVIFYFYFKLEIRNSLIRWHKLSIIIKIKNNETECIECYADVQNVINYISY